MLEGLAGQFAGSGGGGDGCGGGDGGHRFVGGGLIDLDAHTISAPLCFSLPLLSEGSVFSYLCKVVLVSLVGITSTSKSGVRTTTMISAIGTEARSFLCHIFSINEGC